MIHWKPQKRQAIALVRTEDEILYGGARGGGKTDAGQVWMIEPRYIEHPKYRGLVIRKNADDLSDWTDRAKEMYKPLKAVFTGKPAIIEFPSGAKIRLGHLKDESAYSKYQGHEYQKELIEELTQIPREKDYEKLLASNRSTIKELRPQLFATTNPDGDGHDWVKKRWQIPDEPAENVETKVQLFDKITGRHIVKTRVFVPARLEDNKYLLEDDGYIGTLASITDDDLRRQWREGSWAQPKVAGAYYAKQLKEATEKGRITNVPVESLPVDTIWDLGIGDSMAIWMMQCVGKEVRLVDYLEGEGEGIIWYIKELQKKNYVWGDHFMPHDAEVREMTTGVTRKDTAEANGLTDITIVPKLPVDDGIEMVRQLFNKCWFDEKRCSEGLRALKYYKKIFDDKRATFKNKPDHNWASHGADSFRYLATAYRLYKENKGSEATYKQPDWEETHPGVGG